MYLFDTLKFILRISVIYIISLKNSDHAIQTRFNQQPIHDENHNGLGRNSDIIFVTSSIIVVCLLEKVLIVSGAQTHPGRQARMACLSFGLFVYIPSLAKPFSLSFELYNFYSLYTIYLKPTLSDRALNREQ
jgi:hypothetical protein